MKTYRLVIFDCDGTLSDSRTTIVGSVQRAFAGQGLPVPSSHDIQRRVGLSLEEFVRDLCPDREVDVSRLSAEYRKDARRRLHETGVDPLFPGIQELIEKLDETGVDLAIATGKSQRGLRSLLERHGLLVHFTSLQTADDAPSKPHPGMVLQACEECGWSAEHAVMVGDTVFDMQAALSAGVDAIGVGWGYHDEAELRAAGALTVVTTVPDLARQLRVDLG